MAEKLTFPATFRYNLQVQIPTEMVPKSRIRLVSGYLSLHTCRLKLGELLLRNKLVTKEQLDKALELQKTNNSKLGYNLVKMGFVSDEEIATCLSKQFGISAINLSHFEIDQSVLDLVPVEVCRKYDLLPVNRTGAVLTVAMSDPTNIRAMDEINFICGYQVEPVVASEYAIKESIDKYYGSTHALELKQAMQAAIAERE